jgi:serine/threonine-protein kinase
MAAHVSADGSSVEWRPGTVIAEKYCVRGVIGSGGVGDVIKARHTELDEPVALKILKPRWLAVPQVVARFLQEGRAAAKLKGEHVTRIYDVGRTEGGLPFLVMEYLEGEDLSAVITRGSVPISDAVDWIIESCDALGEAHSMGIIHRDVKPQNLFLVRRHGLRRIKLLDFGISRLPTQAGDQARVEQAPPSVIGTPAYMSPEQVRGEDEIEPRADIWALGVVLYELLTGRLPFYADTFPALTAKILAEPPERSLSSLRPSAPEALEAVVDRCLRKDPQERFADVAELVLALLPFAHPRQRVTFDHLLRVQMDAGAAWRPSDPGGVKASRGSAETLVAPQPSVSSDPAPPRSSEGEPSGTASTSPDVPLQPRNDAVPRARSRPVWIALGGVVLASAALGAAWIYRDASVELAPLSAMRVPIPARSASVQSKLGWRDEAPDPSTKYGAPLTPPTGSSSGPALRPREARSSGKNPASDVRSAPANPVNAPSRASADATKPPLEIILER